MKLLLLVTASLLLVLPDAAMALQGKGQGQGKGKGQTAHGPQHPGNGPAAKPAKPGKPGGPAVTYYRPGAGKPGNFRAMSRRGFVYPPGWKYHRWAKGAKMPPVFLSPTYYFDDYALMHLAPPPPDHRWVRYGPDLVLVRPASGIVIDVIFSAFL